MFQLFASKVVIASLFCVGISFAVQNDPSNTFPAGSEDHLKTDNKYRLMLKRTVKYGNFVGAAASIGVAGLNVITPSPLLNAILVIPSIGLSVGSALTEPENNPKIAIGLGISNVLLCLWNALFSFCYFTGADPVGGAYFAAQGTKNLVTAGYQFWAAQKALRNDTSKQNNNNS